LKELPFPIGSVFPSTRYFEIDSAVAGARYAVFITLPMGYGRDPAKRYPVIYVMDGNSAVRNTGSGFLSADAIFPIEPFITVAVGYPPAEASKALAVRARDLLPPGEPLLPDAEAAIATAVKAGAIDQAGAELYLRNLRNPAGDKFLAFLETELHPLVAAGHQVDDARTGLFGYSYGGLFATYVALQRSPLFRRIGAGSPGIIAKVSRVFDLYEREWKAGADHSGRMLHMTVSSPEITHPSIYQTGVGAGSVEFMTLAGQRPLKGLRFSARLIEHESHFTGGAPSWSDYLRTCYPKVG
jgi:predicted alpha/beta superfamily hydrolase